MLSKCNNIRFTTKLFIAVVLISAVSIVITTGNGIRMSNQGLYALGEAAIIDTHKAVTNSLQMYNDTVRKKLDGNIRLFKQEIKSKGLLALDETNTIEQKMTNQISKQTEQRTIPKLQRGISYLNDSNELVDNIEKLTGSSVTIFQLVDKKLLRISTYQKV